MKAHNKAKKNGRFLRSFAAPKSPILAALEGQTSMFLDNKKMNGWFGRIELGFFAVLLIIAGALGLLNGAKPIVGYGLFLGGVAILLLAIFLERSTAEIIGKWIGW